MGGLTAVWTTNLAPQGWNWPIGGHNWQWTQIRSELRSLVWGPGNPQSYGRFPWPLGGEREPFSLPSVTTDRPRKPGGGSTTKCQKFPSQMIQNMVSLVQTTDLPPVAPREPNRVARNPRQAPQDRILALPAGPPPRGPFRRNFRNFRRASWTSY